MKRYIVAGSRGITDEQLVRDCMNEVWREVGEYEVISGMARGIDTLAYNLAGTAGITRHAYPALWDEHGKSAGYKRNVQMAEAATGCIVLWDGSSKGAKHMMDIAIRMGLDLWVWTAERGLTRHLGLD